MSSTLTVASLRLGETAPDFEAETTQGRISFHEWAGNSWVLLFSHPKDFTPVCTTELGALAKLQPEFDRRGVKLIGLSVDSVFDHHQWRKDIEETQACTVKYPIIGDSEKLVAYLYGMIHPVENDTFPVRSVFIIDPQKKIRLTLTYPASTGRNMQEILRVVDALQLADRSRVATPVNWQPGEDVIIPPAIQDEREIKRLFPQDTGK